MEVIFAAIIAVIGALLGYYFLESLHAARQQKLIAVRLEAYLGRIVIGISDVNENILLLSHILENKLQEIFDEEGVEGFLEADKKLKKEINGVMLSMKNDPEIRKDIKEFFKETKEMNEEVFRFEVDTLKQQINNLLENKLFISNEEAAKLSLRAVYRVMDLRDNAEKLYTAYILLLINTRTMKDFNNEEIFEILLKIVKYLLKISGHTKPLLEEANNVNKTSTLKLVLDKMFGGAL